MARAIVSGPDMMLYSEFLQRVIETGIDGAQRSYANDPPKRRGAVAGFRACEGKSPRKLSVLLDEARQATRDALDLPIDEYWEIRCYEAEVAWVCTCVSVVLANEGKPSSSTRRRAR
jgi:hypothetical protein